jgi:outer membrane protein
MTEEDCVISYVKGSLTESQRAQQENAIISKEKSAKELRNAYFGQDGYLQKKSEELMQPIREKVQKAIDKIAENENFMIIFDLAILQGVVYDNPKYDLSARVLEEINAK